jgi:hypothetical protein
MSAKHLIHRALLIMATLFCLSGCGLMEILIDPIPDDGDDTFVTNGGGDDDRFVERDRCDATWFPSELCDYRRCEHQEVDTVNVETTCLNAWYETTEGHQFDCPSCDNCTSQLGAAIDACS